MTQEEKDLLLKDLSARLPYGVIVNVKGFDYDYNDKLTQIYKGVGCSIQVTTNMPYDIEQVKPYLFPMSSMTDEQREELKREYCNIACDNIKKMFANPDESHLYSSKSSSFEIDYFNKHHIDYRGLIPKDLAIDATGLNIY